MPFFDDPTTMALLGMGAGFGQASAASRLPVSLGQVLGGGAGGMMQGGRQYLEGQRLEADTADKNADTMGKLWPLNMRNALSGQPVVGIPQLTETKGVPAPDANAFQTFSTMSIPPDQRKIMGLPVTETEIRAATSYGFNTPAYWNYVKTANLANDKMLTSNDRQGTIVVYNPDTNKMEVKSAVVSGPHGTTPDPNNPTQLRSSGNNLGILTDVNKATTLGSALVVKGGEGTTPDPNDPSKLVPVAPVTAEALKTAAKARKEGEVDAGVSEVARNDGSFGPVRTGDLLNQTATTTPPADWRATARANGPSFIAEGTGGVEPHIDAAGPYARTVAFIEGLNPVKNATPGQTAQGWGQFNDKTWPTVLRALRPELKDLPDAVLNTIDRDNTKRNMDAINVYAGMNAATLAKANLPVNSGTLWLSHFLGPGGAQTVLKADPESSLGAVLPAEVLRVNPQLQGKTVQDILDTVGMVKKMAETKGGPKKDAPKLDALSPDMDEAVAANMPKVVPGTTKLNFSPEKIREETEKQVATTAETVQAARSLEASYDSTLNVLRDPKFNTVGAGQFWNQIAQGLVQLPFVDKNLVNDVVQNVAQGQAMAKNYGQLARGAVLQTKERSTNAMGLQAETLPNLNMQKESQIYMVHMLKATTVDDVKMYQEKMQEWLANPKNTNKSLAGFDAWYNKHVPITGIVAKGYKDAQDTMDNNDPGYWKSPQARVLLPVLKSDGAHSKMMDDFYAALPPGTWYRGMVKKDGKYVEAILQKGVNGG